MKKKYIVLSIILAVLFVQCRKSDDNDDVEETPCVEVEVHNYPDSRVHIGQPISTEHGRATARKMDKSWESGCRVEQFSANLLSILFATGPDSTSILHELITIDDIEERTGCFDLASDGFTNYGLRDFDYSIGEWKLIQQDGLGNNLHIDSLSGDSIWGRFSFSFLDSSDVPGKMFQPELIRFYNGEFEAKIIR